MPGIENFLSKEEEEEIIAAIKIAEKNTSGEIRVHIESIPEKDPFERAVEVFHKLKMSNTTARNGVLIYIAVHRKKFVIYGDEGIDKVVPDDFWDTTKNTMETHFKQGNFKQGIIDGILKAGDALNTYFPREIQDENELSDTISKG